MNNANSAIKLHVRWMIKRDMPEVLAIEAASFTEPWLEGDFVRCLRQRNCIPMCVECLNIDEDRWPVGGYLIYELHPGRMHILTVVVDPKLRRLGLATRMIDKMKEKLHNARRSQISIDVHESNLIGQKLLQINGFKAEPYEGGKYIVDGDIHMRYTLEAIVQEDYKYYSEDIV